MNYQRGWTRNKGGTQKAMEKGNIFIIGTKEDKWFKGKRKFNRLKVEGLKKCKLFKETVEIIDGRKNPYQKQKVIYQKKSWLQEEIIS